MKKELINAVASKNVELVNQIILDEMKKNTTWNVWKMIESTKVLLCTTLFDSFKSFSRNTVIVTDPSSIGDIINEYGSFGMVQTEGCFKNEPEQAMELTIVALNFGDEFINFCGNVRMTANEQ